MTWGHPAVSTLRAYVSWPPTAYQQHGDGPTRVVTDEPDPEFVARPVGFAPSARHRRAVEVDAPTTATRYWMAAPGSAVLRIAPRPGVHRRSDG